MSRLIVFFLVICDIVSGQIIIATENTTDFTPNGGEK